MDTALKSPQGVENLGLSNSPQVKRRTPPEFPTRDDIGDTSSFAVHETPDEMSQTKVDIKVYKRRWYILALFSLMAALQAGVWNQWGPISRTCGILYGWTSADIALFANWGPIMFIPTCLAWSWLLDTKGLRPACLLAAAFITVGAGVRCISQDANTFTWLVHAGHILNGLAGPVGKGGVAKLSAVWFPPEQRTTSTTIGFVVIGLGLGLTFILGPLLVPEIMETIPRNATLDNLLDGTFLGDIDNSSVINGSWLYNLTDMEIDFLDFDVNVTDRDNNTLIPDEVIEQHKQAISYYLYGTFAVCALVFLLMLFYFPSQPPLPPSTSASVERLDYASGLKQLARKRQYWQIAIAYGLCVGTRDIWGSAMLDVNMKANGISQSDAGWLGFYGFLAAAVTGIIVGRFADRFQKRLRLILIVLEVLALLSYLWMILLILEIVPRTRAELYAANIVKSIANGADSPLFFELVCEISYPVAEGVTNLSVTGFANVSSLIYLGILSIRSIGTDWMNWFLVGAFSLTILLLSLMVEGKRRSDVDIKPETKL